MEMSRYIKIFKHKNCYSLYYYEEGTLLEDLITQLRIEPVDFFEVDSASYELFEKLKRRLSLLKDIYGKSYTLNTFNSGFSLIYPKEYSKWLQSFIDNIHQSDLVNEERKKAEA